MHIYNKKVAEKKICRNKGNIVEVFKCFYFGLDRILDLTVSENFSRSLLIV